MTLTEMTAAINERENNMFGNDYAGFYNISRDEAERIAEKSESPEEFDAI